MADLSLSMLFHINEVIRLKQYSKYAATQNSLNFEKYLVFEASFGLMLPYFS